MKATRLRQLEKRLAIAADGIGGVLLTMHPDGSGTDEATGKTYTAADISDRVRRRPGWFVCLEEEIVKARTA